jgi:hypothetical protein
MVLFVLEPLPVHAAATLVQENGNGDSFFSPPYLTPEVTVVLSSSVTSGDVLVLGVAWLGSVTSITDTRGSSFSLAVSKTGSDISSFPSNVAIYIATLTSSGPETVTAKFSTGEESPFTGLVYSAYDDVFVYEVAGVTTAGAATGTGGLGSGTTAQTSSVSFPAGAFLLGLLSNGCNCTVTAGAGFTLSPVTFVAASDVEYSDPVSSPTTFPVTLNFFGAPWTEVGIALSPTSPIPEYPLGLPILAIFMLIGYGIIRRKNRN